MRRKPSLLDNRRIWTGITLSPPPPRPAITMYPRPPMAVLVSLLVVFFLPSLASAASATGIIIKVVAVLEGVRGGVAARLCELGEEGWEGRSNIQPSVLLRHWQ